jgi:hypothetical protein
VKLRYEPLYTVQGQNRVPEIHGVYADDQFIVERHFLVPQHPRFEYRLVVKRRDRQPIGDWRTLQDAKNQTVGEDREAVQVFPPESEVTDTANLYHLWVFRAGVRSGLRVETAAKE